MASRIRPHARKVLLVLLLLGVAAWLAPQFFSAERYRGRVQAGLERALDRQVSFGAISIHLLPRPGFSMDNVVIGEGAAFGAEPFAHVDHMDCDLRLRSLLRGRLELLRLSLERPGFNVVRNPGGQWNLESLLGRQSPGGASPSSQAASNLHLEISDARINFKLNQDKRPFAIDSVEGWLDFDRAHHGVSFHLTGNPVRTDLLLPSPGELEFEGEWMPGAETSGPLDATLSARSSIIYDWIPILTGRNPEIYGVIDANAHLTGSFRVLKVEGRIRLTQLHRWEEPPPTGALDSDIHFRGQYDREHSRLSFESADATFANSHLHLSGSIEGVGARPELDLVLAVERSRLEDLYALEGRFTPRLKGWSAAGRVDALMTIQGPWEDRHYGGFVQIRDVRLTTPGGAYPVSEIALRIDRDGARLAPLTIELAPRVTLVAEGSIARKSSAKKLSARLRTGRAGKSPGRPEPQPFEYELNLEAKSVPLRELVHFARSVGVRWAEGVDARGESTATFTFSGPVPIRGVSPNVVGHLDLRAASLLIPGLTEPLNIPKAHIQFENDSITASPFVAVMGTSVFSGRLEHAGARLEPWKFDVRANALSIEQGALWFDVLGNRQPVPLLLRLPGLSSLVERRSAASSLFSALRATGKFSTPRLTYRALTIHDVQASVEIADRSIRLSSAFRVAGGRGTDKLSVDLTQSPARITSDVSLTDVHFQPLLPFLPVKLRQARGAYSLSGHVVTTGLSRQEIATNLEGKATVKVKNVNFGDFDPLGTLVQADGRISSEPVRGETALRTATLSFQVGDRRATFESDPFVLSGTPVMLEGWCAFDGTADVTVVVGSRRPSRLAAVRTDFLLGARPMRVHLTGPLGKLAVEPAREISRANR